MPRVRSVDAEHIRSVQQSESTNGDQALAPRLWSMADALLNNSVRSIRLVLAPLPILLKLERLIGSVADRQMPGAHESRTLAALRDSLLPKLIFGQLRIRDAQRIVEAAV